MVIVMTEPTGYREHCNATYNRFSTSEPLQGTASRLEEFGYEINDDDLELLSAAHLALAGDKDFNGEELARAVLYGIYKSALDDYNTTAKIGENTSVRTRWIVQLPDIIRAITENEYIRYRAFKYLADECGFKLVKGA